MKLIKFKSEKLFGDCTGVWWGYGNANGKGNHKNGCGNGGGNARRKKDIKKYEVKDYGNRSEKYKSKI